MSYKGLALAFFLFFLQVTVVFAKAEQCSPYDLPYQSFALPLKNASLTLACCGKSKNEPGFYLGSQDKKYSYESCLARYKNGMPASSSSNKFGFLECIGAGMTQAYESIKDNIASVWGMVTEPLAFLSDLSELGKMLIDKEGRTKLYQFIKKSVQDKMGNVKQCLNKSEIEEESCKIAGQLIANFVPPVIMVKAIVKSVKLGKATKELSAAIDNTIKKKKTTVVVPKNTGIRVFSQAEIKKNALLSSRDRVRAFEKLAGVKAGTFSGNRAKFDAIIAAHNLGGTVGKLTFGQIRDRVRLLRSKGFTDKEIRLGLDAGIFGHLDANPIDKGIVLAALPKPDTALQSAKVVSRIPDTKYGSGQSLFKGDNNDGIDILSIGNKKVFSKTKYDPAVRRFSPQQVRMVQDSFVNESKFAKKLSDLGLGPKYYGSKISSDGKYSIATEFVDGFEVHLGDTVSNIKELKLGTIHEMKQKALKAVEHGIDPFDLQFRVDKNGIPFIVDPEHFSVLDPKRKGEVLKEIESDFADLLNQKRLQNVPRR